MAAEPTRVSSAVGVWATSLGLGRADTGKGDPLARDEAEYESGRGDREALVLVGYHLLADRDLDAQRREAEQHEEEGLALEGILHRFSLFRYDEVQNAGQQQPNRADK